MCDLLNLVISVANQLCPLSSEHGQLYEVGLERDERVSGQRRRLVLEEQL